MELLMNYGNNNVEKKKKKIRIRGPVRGLSRSTAMSRPMSSGGGQLGGGGTIKK